MNLKFYLNKFAKIDSIENYNLKFLRGLENTYKSFLEESEGIDPDFPGIGFGGKKGKAVKGVNKFKVDRILESRDVNPMSIFDEFN